MAEELKKEVPAKKVVPVKKVKKVIRSQKTKQPIRLYVKGVHVSFRRSHSNTYHHTSLLKVEGVNTTKEANFYLGKRVAYIHKGKNPAKGKTRVIWGRITRAHGNSGVVRAKFNKNLPPKSLGATLRVMLFPSRV